jgi:hypothetical protein
MTRFALLPPTLQALERERHALSLRLGYLPVRSRRGRVLRRRCQALTARLLKLEAALAAESRITAASQDSCEPEAFKHFYWWDAL